MGSKPSKVTDVSLQIRPQQIANNLNSELEEKYNASQKKDKVIGNNVGGDGKAEEGEEEEDEDGGNDDETANKDAQDEDVLRQIDESKEICKRNVDIIRLEIDADGTDGHAIETEKIVKCSKIIGGLYFKLKKKKIAKRRIHRRAVALYLVESGGAAVVVNAIRKATSHWWRQQDTQDNTNNVGYYNIFYFATQILWNFSDASDQFAKCIADEGVIAVAEEAMEKEYQHAMAHSIDLKSKRVMKASLAITANCSFHELSRDVVKKSNMLGILGKINNVDFGDLDIYFVLIPAYIVNEEQSKELFHDEVAIGNIVEHVRKASKMKTRRSKGFSLHELCVLVGRLAVNDVNKTQLTKAGAEPILIQVVQRGNISEKIAALEALKHLSFSDGKSILQDSIDIFEELLKSENKKIRKAAEGILWNINNNKSAESGVTGNKDPHVMISYQWGSQPEMIKIKDILKNAGYKVWMDIESMEGSTLEGMASAVENAAVVFMGISQKYKESANCRMEAEYAFQLKKEIIPLMMDDNYKPDGWLGFLIGAKLYYKLVQESDFTDIGEKLFKVLGDKGKEGAVPSNEDVAPAVDLTDKFDDILGDIDKGVKTEILLKQKSYQENLQKLKTAVSKKDFTSRDTTQPTLFTVATMYGQLKKHDEDTRAKYRQVLLRTFLDEGAPDALLATLRFCEDHGWRKEDDTVDDDYWKPFNLCISTMWNFTDLSGQFCTVVLRKNVLDTLRKVLQSEGPRYRKDETNAIAGRAVRSCLASIYNCCIHDKSRGIIRDANVVDQYLSPLLSLQDERPRTYMIFIMAYTLNEEQSERFFADEGLIAYIIGRLTRAAANENHKDGGYSALELTEGVKRLAVNDSNKVQIVNAGGLVPLESLLNDGKIAEKIAAAGTVWELSFDDKNKKVILEREALVQELEKYATHENPRLKKACEGTLWVLREKQAKYAKAFSQLKSSSQEGQVDAGDEPEQHVMISYQWNYQPLMIQIKDRLKAEGYRVWMDIEQMGGSTLAAMADAVEKAAAIIVCVTQEYKDSANCRTEAEYAYHLQKTIVPVKPVGGYKPDGWLGMLLGVKLYFKFDHNDQFETSFQALVKELGERGRGRKTSRGSGRKRAHSAKGRKKEAVATATSVTWMSSAPSQSIGALTWSQEDVNKWLKDNELDISKLKNLSGEQLVYLKDLRREAPEFFYHYLETYFKIVDLKQLMKFTKSLDKLS